MGRKSRWACAAPSWCATRRTSWCCAATRKTRTTTRSSTTWPAIHGRRRTWEQIQKKNLAWVLAWKTAWILAKRFPTIEKFDLKPFFQLKLELIFFLWIWPLQYGHPDYAGAVTELKLRLLNMYLLESDVTPWEQSFRIGLPGWVGNEEEGEGVNHRGGRGPADMYESKDYDERDLVYYSETTSL